MAGSMTAGIIWVWLAALMGVFFTVAAGAAVERDVERDIVLGQVSPERPQEVEFRGLVLVGEGKVYVLADAEESWVFQLPQGFLFFNGEEAIWAPTLKTLALRLLRAALAEARRSMRFAQVSYVDAKGAFWKNYWRQQVEEAARDVDFYRVLIEAVERGEMKPIFADFDEIEEMKEKYEVL